MADNASTSSDGNSVLVTRLASWLVLAPSRYLSGIAVIGMRSIIGTNRYVGGGGSGGVSLLWSSWIYSGEWGSEHLGQVVASNLVRSLAVTGMLLMTMYLGCVPARAARPSRWVSSSRAHLRAAVEHWGDGFQKGIGDLWRLRFRLVVARLNTLRP